MFVHKHIKNRQALFNFTLSNLFIKQAQFRFLFYWQKIKRLQSTPRPPRAYCVMPGNTGLRLRRERVERIVPFASCVRPPVWEGRPDLDPQAGEGAPPSMVRFPRHVPSSIPDHSVNNRWIHWGSFNWVIKSTKKRCQQTFFFFRVFKTPNVSFCKITFT